MATAKKQENIEIPTLEREIAEFFLVGETPLIFHRMSQKAKEGLLVPTGPMTAAQKKNNVKHDPIREFRDSLNTFDSEDEDVLLCFPSTAFKKALGTAALDVEGATKAGIGRLVRVLGYSIGIYGVPLVFSTIVRMSDQKRTPDVRTRAILPEWACILRISFVRPLLNVQGITNLLAGAGEIVGIGDFRQEKGAGDFGLFRVTSADDPDYVRISRQAREEQAMAIKNPRFYDRETEELVSWYDDKMAKRK